MHTLYFQEEFLACICPTRMLVAIFAKVPVVALTATVAEQTKCYTSSSLGMVDPEIIAVNSNRQNRFYTCSTRPHTGDDKIKMVLLLYIAKLQVMRERIPLQWFTIIYTLSLWTLYIDSLIGKFYLETVSLDWWFS